MKFIPVSRSPTNTENGTPGYPAYALVVLQKCPKKQHVMSRVHLLLCVCYTCSDPILTYVLYYSFFLVFMSKKSKRVIVIFMVLNFDFWLQKLFSSSVKTFWSNLHFCHVTEKLMDLWLGWKCVTKLPLRAKIFSLSLTMFDFNDFYLTAIKLRVYSKHSLKIKVKF